MFRVFLCLMVLSTSAFAELTKEQWNMTQAFGLNNRLNTPIAEYMMSFSTLYAVGLPIMKQKYGERTLQSAFTLSHFNQWRKPELIAQAADTLKDPCIKGDGRINTESIACEKAMIAAYLMNKGLYEQEATFYFEKLAYGTEKSEASDIIFNLMDYYQNHETPQHKQDMFELQAIMNSP